MIFWVFLHKCLLIITVPSLMVDEYCVVITGCSPDVVVSKSLLSTNFSDVRIIYHMFYRLLCL
jgi:hypothetical protein